MLACCYDLHYTQPVNATEPLQLIMVVFPEIYSYTVYSLQKYIDIFAGTFGFWLFGYAVSGNTDQGAVGEEQDYIFWFFRVSRQHLTFSYHYNDTHTPYVLV